MGRKARFSTFPIPAVRRDQDPAEVPSDLASPPDPERASVVANIITAGALGLVTAGILVYAWLSWPA